MKLVITGGGTGGHVFGGVAIAQEFLKRDPSNEVLFVGSAYGLETRLVPKAGYRLETLQVGKLVGQNPVKRLMTLAQIPIAIFKCMRLLRRFGADAVVGVGGYAAGPCIVAAKLLGIKTGILEQNSVAGFTNRVSAKLANDVFLAFDQVPPGFPQEKCLVTGNPARSHLRPSPSKDGALFTVFAFGGSQGAAGINKLLLEAAQILMKQQPPSPHIIHQTGEREYEAVKKAYSDMGYPSVEVHKFIDDMQAMYDRASVVLCRAGSGTISELGATKNAAIFIPFPLAAGNHQEINARALEKADAGVVLVQGKATGEDLAQVLLHCQSHPARLSQMRDNIAKFYKSDAAQRIVDKLSR